MRRHDLDVFSLITGILITLAAAALIVSAYVDLHVDHRVVWSVILVVVGAAGLAGAVAALRRTAQTPD